MIKLRMKDKDGNGYWLHDDGQMVLALKEIPPVGVQHRTIAWLLRNGVYDLRHTRWNPRYDAWYPARFPLIKTVSFGIKVVHIEAGELEGIEAKGFVHPKVLTHRDERLHSSGYEEQLQLKPSDLCETIEEAEEIWKRLKKKLKV